MGRVQVDSPARSAAAKIEWNVDMKLTVSNVNKSKIFQRSRAIVFFLLAIIFAVILSHLKTEVRALRVQVQSINVNLLLLMSKYDRLNRNLNRASIRRFEKLLVNKSLRNVEWFLEDASSASNAAEGPDEARDESSRAYNYALAYLNSIKGGGSQEERTVRDEAYDDGGNESVVSKSLSKLEESESSTSDNNLRIERAILSIEKENATIQKQVEQVQESNRDIIVDDGTAASDDYYENVDEDDEENDGELQLGISRREPRSGRSKRDEGRGPLVATFVGAIPEQHVTDTVFIGPWVRSAKNDTRYSLNKFHLVEDKRSIEVTQTGLYMISAQIFYFGEPTNYSYWILLNSEGKSNTQKLVKCSTASSTSATEVSCYTSVITPLQRGDRVHIQQQEKDRLINMREGHSYIQLVLLSKTIRRRRLR